MELRDPLKESLRDCVLLSELPSDAETALLTLPEVTVESYPAGSWCMQSLPTAPRLGILLSGSAVAQKNGGKHPVFLRVFGAGELLGVASLYAGSQAYVAQIRAKSDCTVLWIPQPALEIFFTAYPAAARNYIAFLSGRIRYLNTRIDAFTAGNAEEKLRYYLLSVSSQTQPQKQTLTVSFAKLAQALHIGRASLYRAMDALGEKGMLEKQGDTLRLLPPLFASSGTFSVV